MPTPPDVELAADPGSFLLPPMMSAKFREALEEAVETEPFCVLLAPKLFVLLRADSLLLPPLALPGMTRGGPLRLVCAFSCGV